MRVHVELVKVLPGSCTEYLPHSETCSRKVPAPVATILVVECFKPDPRLFQFRHPSASLGYSTTHLPKDIEMSPEENAYPSTVPTSIYRERIEIPSFNSSLSQQLHLSQCHSSKLAREISDNFWVWSLASGVHLKGHTKLRSYSSYCIDPIYTQHKSAYTS